MYLQQMRSADFENDLNVEAMIPLSYPCYGVLSSQLNSDLLAQSQQNYRDLLNDNLESFNYCPILLSLKNQSESLIRLDGLMGFFFPRRSKELDGLNCSIRKPSSFYYSMNKGNNEFSVQSYICAKNKNFSKDEHLSCIECKKNWRTFRNKTAIKYLKESSHKKILKCEEKKYLTLNEEFQEHVKNNKLKWISMKKKLNKLFKRASYWKKKFEKLEVAVLQWRKAEEDRNGFLTINEDDATLWTKFYKFIDEKIESEHIGNVEMIELHKELIRTETEYLGKFNSRNDKRGVRSTKISSRILNYSISLANSLGRVCYEKEAELRNLPTWDTISR